MKSCCLPEDSPVSAVGPENLSSDVVFFEGQGYGDDNGISMDGGSGKRCFL